MSTYIKPGKALEYDNAPDWLIAYMRYRRTVLGNTPASVMTFFGNLREFGQWVQAYKITGRQPREAAVLRQIDILNLPLSAMAEITKNDVETYLYFLTDVLGNEAKTRNKKLVAIQCFYDYLLDQQDALGITLGENPASRIRRPKTAKKQPIYLPEDDCTALLEGISGENTTGTTLAKDGVDLLVIQQVLGHENPATTEIYTHLGQDDVAKAVRDSRLGLLGIEFHNYTKKE